MPNVRSMFGLRPLATASTLVALAATSASLHAQTTYPEVEPNDTKDTANGTFVLAVGDSITGNTQGAGNPSVPAGQPTSADYFKIKIAPAPLAIYRNRLTTTSTGAAFPNVNIRGHSVIDGARSYTQYPAAPSNGDASLGGSTATVPYLAWYGFGKEEVINIRTNGSATTTDDYTLTFADSTVITPIDAGTMPGGVMTITSVGQGHTTDTDLWVYDSNFNAIPGYGNNNGNVAGDSNRSRLTRDFAAPGDYYVAIANTNLANNLPSPYPDDLQPNDAVVDFPNFVANNQPSVTAANVSFAIIDGAGVSHLVAGTRTVPFEIVWVKFTVTAPVTGACCMPNGTCTVSSQAGCALNGGTYAGDGVTCATAACPQPPIGACCLDDGSCATLDQYACATASGYWNGAGTSCSTGACKQFLETVVPNSSLAAAASFFVDATATNALTISELEYTTTAIMPTVSTLRIYTRPGTYMAHDNDPAGWALHDTVMGVCLGRMTPIHVKLNNPIGINAGDTVAIAFKADTGGIWYASQITGTLETTYSNSDLSIFSDRSRAGLFSGTLSTSRTWAGKFYYTMGVTPPCGTSDFNGDGDFGTDADIEAFFACLAGNCCPTCFPGGADFNMDGDTGTDADIESFFRVLAGGAC